MLNLQTLRIFPHIPKNLAFLETLSRNLWWTWDHQARELFRRIHPALWDESNQNPLLFGTALNQEHLESLAEDESFLAQMDVVRNLFEQRIIQRDASQFSSLAEHEVIAYFSMEFGLHASIPLFAGGLGILAGDHLKAASCLGLPLVGVGLLFRKGYFRQFLDENGRQQEAYPAIDLEQLPLSRSRDRAGKELEIIIPGPSGDIRAAVWQMQVGRIRLLLLDTHLKDNPPEVRKITENLYAGDQATRLAQEVLLGIGGMRALEALGLFPAVCHLNEGHSTFSSLERMAQLIRKLPIDPATAMEIVPRTTIFTTHTPVAAGHDEFPVDMVRPVFQPYCEQFKIPESELLSWGQPPEAHPETPVSMFIIGSKTAGFCNGVSNLHGQVARNMWAHLWPQRPTDEIPISHVTNGIHIPTWMSEEMGRLLERYLGPDWMRLSCDPKRIERVLDISSEELWSLHERCRTRLIAFCRRCMVQQYRRRHAAVDVLDESGSVLKPNVLTIGFARRFAAYKRSGLLLQDPERFEAILKNTEHPVQIIFAGKAHPKDNDGKELIQKIIAFAKKPDLRHKIVFLEDYNMHMGRHLYQGVDVWLNTPRRPLEACGTSGMKAAVNGALNVSILDGWWDEAYQPEIGWAIGPRDDANGHPAQQDSIDAQSLYSVLENEIIPCFYDRGPNDLPEKWITMMRHSMQTAMTQYCSLRMVNEYTRRFYHPLSRRMQSLTQEDSREAKHLAAQKQRLSAHWSQVHIAPPERINRGSSRVGDQIRITTRVHLGELHPEEVQVELYFGRLQGVDSVASSNSLQMQVVGNGDNGQYEYECFLPCETPGHFGFTARVVPAGDVWMQNLPGFITWA